MLVIECDAARIRRQGFDVARTIVASTLISGAEVTHVEVNAPGDLEDGLRALGRKRYGAIAVVGHANAGGMGVTAERLVAWSDLGRMLARRCPRKMLILACQAGLPKVGVDLFEAIPSLERVYACPVALSFAQGRIVSAFATLLLGGAPLDAGLRQILQGVHLVANKGLFFELRREDLATRKGQDDAELETAFLALLREMMVNP